MTTDDATHAPLSDEELLRLHVAGDPRGYRELVDRFAAELHRFLMRFLGQPALVEDVIQETFLQVHVSATRFDPTRRVKPWLFTIAANKARDLIRTRTRRREMSLDGSGSSEDAGSLLDVFVDPGDAPDQEMSEDDESRRVRRAVSQLSAHLREVLILGYYHQLPYKEIAEILDVPIGTVKSRLHAAVAQFGDIYRRETGTAGAPLKRNSEPRGSFIRET